MRFVRIRIEPDNLHPSPVFQHLRTTEEGANVLRNVETGDLVLTHADLEGTLDLHTRGVACHHSEG